MSALGERVVRAREWIFTSVNGEEGISVHSRPDGEAVFRRLYEHPAAGGRSQGAGLSDLFWYWLAPGPHVHQEHLEPGSRYEEVARCTRQILARWRREQWEAAAAAATARAVARQPLGRRPRLIRLRDATMPIWAEVFYELVFATPCPPVARELIVANADDVVSALKGTRLRHMGRRAALTDHLRGLVDAGAVAVALPAALTRQEQVWYLQGAFFNTAVVQMSEAMAHLLLLLAAHEEIQGRLRETPEDHELFNRVSDEALRLYPLFGIAHRITTEAIHGVTPALPAGSVLLFDYTAYQHAGVEHPERFDPDRFDAAFRRAHDFIPYGVSGNRPCPARGVAPTAMLAVTRTLLASWRLLSSAEHTRSLPSRGPALLLAAEDRGEHRRALAALARLDHVQGIGRSLLQLLLIPIMVLHARHLAMCRRFFAAHPDWAPAR